MRLAWFLLILCTVCALDVTAQRLRKKNFRLRTRAQSLATEEQQLTEFLKGAYELRASSMCNKLVTADWEYTTDISNAEKEEELVKATLAEAAFQKEQWQLRFKDAKWQEFSQEDVKRQLKFLSKLGTSALDEEQLSEYNHELNAMAGIYGSARICPYNNQQCDVEVDGMRLEPDMEHTMSKSRNYSELEYVWNQWREVSGKQMRSNFKNYVNLSNLAAAANGYADMGEMWRADYETQDFEADLRRLWEEVRPLYLRLHAYAKLKLRQQYKDKMPSGDLIPAHILGNMWAQSWENIYDILEPFPSSAAKFDITQNMKNKGYDVAKLFSTANEFYTSMGLLSMEEAYGSKAIIEQPEGRDIVCHASAWDFCDKNDFRIKMCASVDEEDFITAHHELGHIQYFMQYKDQPLVFRKGANPGFHETIGDVISLSVSTPQHLVKLGLLDEYEETRENDINALMKSALSKVAFLPFAMVLDSWRWEVFSGAAKEESWNQRWWELRKEYQLVDAPSTRGEDFFDPGAKYHVPGNSQYINYFISHILQFQIHRSLCIAAQQFDPEHPEVRPLHKCDIYRSTAAGKKLRDGLRLGGSKHWSEVLKLMTNETRLSGKALLEYYAPLDDYLKASVREEGEEGEDVDQTIPIVVAAVLGGVVVAAVGAYAFKRFRDKKKKKVPNPQPE